MKVRIRNVIFPLFVLMCFFSTCVVNAQVIREADPNYVEESTPSSSREQNFPFKRTLALGLFQALNGEIPLVYSVNPRERLWFQIGAGATFRYPATTDLVFGFYSAETPTSYGIGPHGQIGLKYYVAQYRSSGFYIGLNARFSHHPSKTEATYNILNESNQIQSVTNDFTTYSNHYYGNLMFGYTITGSSGKYIVETYLGLGAKYREYQFFDSYYTYNEYYDPANSQYSYYLENPQTSRDDYWLPSIKLGLNVGLTWP